MNGFCESLKVAWLTEGGAGGGGHKQGLINPLMPYSGDIQFMVLCKSWAISCDTLYLAERNKGAGKVRVIGRRVAIFTLLWSV